MTKIRDRVAKGRKFSILAVSEGAKPISGEQVISRKGDEIYVPRLGGMGQRVAEYIEDQGFESRVTVLGHVQRGGTPSAADRVLGSRLGVAAADLAVSGTFGRMVALRGATVVDVALDVVRDDPRAVPPAILNVARTLSAP